MAGILGERERHAERAEMLQSILDVAKGRDDVPYLVVSTARLNLSACYRRLGNRDESRRLLEEALEEDRRRFGPENPRTITRLNNLANLLAEFDDLEGAATRMEVVV